MSATTNHLAVSISIRGLRRVAAASLLASAVLTGCSDTRRLDEAAFYEGPVFTLKVVRFYRNLFFNYNGETFSVQCSSANTADDTRRKHACTRFKSWNPTTLPPEMIDPVDKPDHCAPKGTTGDCRYNDYHGDRAPVYEDIQVHPDGRISFIVRTETFKDVAGLRVSSEDAGETWKVDPIKL